MDDKDTERLERAIENIRENYANLRDMDRRFGEDRARLTILENGLMTQYRFQSEVLDKLNTLLDTKLDKAVVPLQKDMEGIKQELKEMKEAKQRDTQWTLRQIIVIIVGFILSGGAIGALEFLIQLVKK